MIFFVSNDKIHLQPKICLHKMSIELPLSTDQKSALELKSSSFNVPALILASHKIADIKQQLQEKVSQAPDFFKNSPLLVDLQELNKQPASIDLRALIKMLRDLEFIPIAISGGNDKQNNTAIELGMAVQSIYTMSGLKHHAPEKIVIPETSSEPASSGNLEKVESAFVDDNEAIPLVENKVISLPVRSGQRVYAKGDLIVLAPVSSGAEIMAEGNIHVYAPLRGRVLAGVLGNTQSSIFCSDLQAELISIAGIYQLRDELSENISRKLVQIYLQGQTLIIKDL
jgi:septum site-determining protein MinC